jgi:hypothetical protein
MSVFVSHASRDTALPLYDMLLADLRRRSRHEVWVDAELAGGQLWWDEICRQIRGCSLFLVVVSPHLKKSDACARELDYATALSKPVLPVRITQVADWELPPRVAPMQVLDYTRRQEPGDAGVECAFSLSDAIRDLAVDPTILPDPLPDQPPLPDSYLSDLQRFLQAPELTLKDQEQFVVNVRMHLGDDDRRPAELAGAINAFLARPDIVYRVHTELARCLERLDQAGNAEPITNAAQIATMDGERLSTSHSDPSPGAPPLKEKSELADAPSVTDPSLTAVGDTVGQVEEGASAESVPVPVSQLAGLRTARLKAPGVDVGRLADSVKGWFESQKLETQVHPLGARVILQCRSSSLARKVGAGSALSVLMGLDGDDLVVEIGGGKWGDKVAVAGVGALIAWPALIPAAVGGFKQATLPRRTISYIESMIPRCTS